MLSPEAIVPHLVYALLLAAVLSPHMRAVRLLVAGAAGLLLLIALAWTGSLTDAAWGLLLLAACLILLGRDLHASAKARFTPEEEEMLSTLLAGVPRSRARHLIDQGIWLTGKEGDVLTREGEPVGHLYWLSAGEARVISQGAQVGTCRAGDLVGELTVLSGETASATVVFSGPARFWCAHAGALRPYLDAHDDIRRAIERSFAESLKAKLRASNRTIAESRAAPAG